MDRSFKAFFADTHRLAQEKQPIMDDRRTYEIWRAHAAPDAIQTLADQREIKTNKRTNLVFDRQVEKLVLMQKLRKTLRSIDEGYPLHGSEGICDVVYSDGEHLFVVREDGSDIQITIGELLADQIWGTFYHFDASVPKNLQKRYAVEQTKNALQTLTNKQLHTFGFSGSPLDEQRASQEGYIAEDLILSLFTKISWDFGFDIRLHPADVYEDSYHKIDFLLECRSTMRGVRTEADAKRVRIGIQLTLSYKHQAKKLKQFTKGKKRIDPSDRIDDIVLVRIPLRQIQELYKQWQHTKTPGGPDAMLDPWTQKMIFKAILQEIYTDDELEEMWEEVGERLRSEPMKTGAGTSAAA